MVDDARADDRCADTFFNHLDNLENALSTAYTSGDPVAAMNRRRRLRPGPINLDVAAPAQLGRCRTRRHDAHRPQPFVDPGDLHMPIVSRTTRMRWGAVARGSL